MTAPRSRRRRRDVAVSVDGLVKTYGRIVAVDGVSFEVERGEIFGTSGQTARDRRTTVECVQGLRRADAGRVPPWVPAVVAVVVVAFLVTAACFASIGVLLGAVLLTVRAAQALGVLLWFVMLIVGGAGPPPEVLTGALAVVWSRT